jgi:hypothetical protein
LARFKERFAGHIENRSAAHDLCCNWMTGGSSASVPVIRFRTSNHPFCFLKRNEKSKQPFFQVTIWTKRTCAGSIRASGIASPKVPAFGLSMFEG